jgi:hypothetical protein
MIAATHLRTVTVTVTVGKLANHCLSLPVCVCLLLPVEKEDAETRHACGWR